MRVCTMYAQIFCRLAWGRRGLFICLWEAGFRNYIQKQSCVFGLRLVFACPVLVGADDVMLASSHGGNQEELRHDWDIPPISFSLCVCWCLNCEYGQMFHQQHNMNLPRVMHSWTNQKQYLDFLLRKNKNGWSHQKGAFCFLFQGQTSAKVHLLSGSHWGEKKIQNEDRSKRLIRKVRRNGEH